MLRRASASPIAPVGDVPLTPDRLIGSPAKTAGSFNPEAKHAWMTRETLVTAVSVTIPSTIDSGIRMVSRARLASVESAIPSIQLPCNQSNRCEASPRDSNSIVRRPLAVPSCSRRQWIFPLRSAQTTRPADELIIPNGYSRRINESRTNRAIAVFPDPSGVQMTFRYSENGPNSTRFRGP